MNENYVGGLGELGRRFLEDLKSGAKPPPPSPEESDLIRAVREALAAEKKAAGETSMMGIRPGSPPVVDMTFFYRMTGDPRRYNLGSLRRDPAFASGPYGGLRAKAEPYAFYDSSGMFVPPELRFFVGPRDSYLQTNVEGSGGCLFGYPSRRFVFSTTVLRFAPNYRTVMNTLLWSGVYRFATRDININVPLYSFVPLNPVSLKPMAFAAVHRQFIIEENQLVLASIAFPRDPFPNGSGIALELPGIMVSPKGGEVVGPQGPQGPQGVQGYQGPIGIQGYQGPRYGDGYEDDGDNSSY